MINVRFAVDIDQLRTDHPNVTALWQAIGRLVTFGGFDNPDTPIVISGNADELIAVYPSRFVLAAVWRPNEGEYSFHS